MQSQVNPRLISTANLGNDVVTYAKIQNVSVEDIILGRVTAGAGDIEEITCTSAGRALLDDANAAAQRTTLGLGTIATQASNSVTITGGSVTGITDITVADGGTGSSSASGARTNLGFADGTYTPTITNVTNVASSTVSDGNYLQVGSTVSVSGRVTIDVTAASVNTEVGLSLPIASNFASTTQCGGGANSTDQAGLSSPVRADATNDRAQIKYIAGAGTGSYEFMYSYTYRVI